MDINGIITSVAISSVFLLLGIPIAFYVGKRTTQKREIGRATDFQKVLTPGSWLSRGSLTVRYGDRDLKQVSRTYLALWNRRGATIHRSEVLTGDPLRIHVEPGDEILQTRIVSFSRPQILAEVGDETQDAHLEFEFLDPGDGFIVEVVHVGGTGAEILGTLPGVTIGEPRRAALGPHSRKMIRGSFRARLRGSGKFGFVVALVLVVLIVTSIVLAAVALSQVRAPEVLDISQFDLTTFEGQREFANESARMTSNKMLAGTIAAPVVALSFALWRVSRLIPRRIVPIGVARNDVEPVE